jgi:hypothetical protein
MYLLHTLFHFLDHRGEGVAVNPWHGGDFVLPCLLFSDEDWVDQVAAHRVKKQRMTETHQIYIYEGKKS